MRHIPLRPIDRMIADWDAVSRSADSATALDRLAGAEAVVADTEATDLGELVAVLHRADGPAERDRAARVLQAMVRSQRLHPLIARAVLQALIPGLVAVARRLDWGSGGDWEDGGAFFVDVVTTAWEVIVEWSGQDRAYAVLDLLSAVRSRLRRQILAQRAGKDRFVVGIDLEATYPTLWSNGTTALDDLARAIEEIAGHGVDPSDAAVLYGSRVLGLTLTELSTMSGRSRRHVVGRRDRAVRGLFAER